MLQGPLVQYVVGHPIASHIVVAIAIMLSGGLVLRWSGFRDGPWTAAAIASAFLFGREAREAEVAYAAMGDPEAFLYGLLPWTWPANGLLEWLVPSLVVFAAAWGMQKPQAMS